MGLREDILATKSKPRKVVKVDLEGFDLSVWVRTVSGLDRERLANAHLGKTGENLTSLMIRLCACDEQGRHLFTDGDMAEVMELDGKALDAICLAAMRLNDFSTKAVDEAGEGLPTST